LIFNGTSAGRDRLGHQKRSDRPARHRHRDDQERPRGTELHRGCRQPQSGTLTVTDGVLTTSIELLGNYVASDGHGGTLITFTTGTQPGGHLGHSNAIASPVTS
jgi:hypothetical protein